MMSGPPYDGKQLDEWLASQDSSKFPGGADYPQRYQTVRNHLCSSVYPHVEMAALWADVQAGRAPIYLTNHGEQHVQHVISRATDLLRTSKDYLGRPFDPYEVFLLLTAILFHDLGNVFGRQDHQNKSWQLMNGLGNAVFPDTAEKRIVSKIAAAHCGIADGTKDLINQLEDEYPLLGYKVRKKALAAVLRLADELADDSTRASRFMLEHGLLEGSEAYHAYSNALKSVTVRDGEISFAFELTREFALRKVHKGKADVYLLDEIYERTLKAHIERLYCMRFLRPYVSVDRISVKIKVYDTFDRDRLPEPIRDPISYCLYEKGYPEDPPGGIYGLCPELQDLTGDNLSQELQGDEAIHGNV